VKLLLTKNPDLQFSELKLIKVQRILNDNGLTPAELTTNEDIR